MRLPRHGTLLSLPAEDPRDALARDEALLEDIAGSDEQSLGRWWVAARPAIVVGLGLRARLADIVDLNRCKADGLVVLDRRAGGGALLLDERMICAAICVRLPDPRVGNDITESYRWLGARLVDRLRALGVCGAHRVEVAEARRHVQSLRSSDDAIARLLLLTCYGALSPHEVVLGEGKKLVGMAQIRRRHAALFQFGVLLRDQAPLADYLAVPDEATRDGLRAALARRTIGLESLSLKDQSASAVAAAIAGATPVAP